MDREQEIVKPLRHERSALLQKEFERTYAPLLEPSKQNIRQAMDQKVFARHLNGLLASHKDVLVGDMLRLGHRPKIPWVTSDGVGLSKFLEAGHVAPSASSKTQRNKRNKMNGLVL
jgi:hypothetical protein